MSDYVLHARIHTETLEKAIKRVMDTKKDIILSDKLKRESAKMYRDKIEQYVPLDHGDLRKSAHKKNAISPYRDGYAIYYDPIGEYGKSTGEHKEFHYGDYQYNGPEWWSRKTEGTYSHWNQHLASFEREDYYRELAQLYVEECNNG